MQNKKSAATGRFLRKDISGLRFGKLTAIRFIRFHKGRTMWEFNCDCGTIKIINCGNVTNGNTGSCGCSQYKDVVARSFKHGAWLGGKPTAEYAAWRGIKDRCYNPKNPNYKNYGLRGIAMCDEWKNDFQAFLKHVGPKPDPSFTIDRIDVNGNYAPGNVRWAPWIVQGNNKRTNKFLTHDGLTLTYSQWERRLNITAGNVSRRVRNGWSVAKSLKTA